MKLQGQVFRFGLNSEVIGRRYLVCTLPFAQARVIFQVERFKAKTGKGEQRTTIQAHANILHRAMESGNYTPTAHAAGLKRHQLKYYSEQEDEDGNLWGAIDLPDGETISLTDGGHRTEALEVFCTDEVEAVLMQPVTFLVHIDGDTQLDFLNLQMVRPVDKTHILAMQILRGQGKEKDKPFSSVAIDVARKLQEMPASPFHRQIRFDSGGSAPLTLNTLCAKGAADGSTSMIGLAKIGLLNKKSAGWLADRVVQAYQAIQEGEPGLLEEGNCLCPPPDGTRGGATLLVGLGNILAYASLHAEAPLPQFVQAVRDVFTDAPVSSSVSVQGKRALMRDLARAYFSGDGSDKHEGVPLPLVQTLVTSAFALNKLPKPKPEKVPKKRAGKVKQPLIEPSTEEEIGNMA